MQRIRFEMLRLRAYTGDSAFEVFGDLGTGSVDVAHPLTPRAVAIFPEFVLRLGHLLDGHVVGRHLDGVDWDGHLEGSHLRDEHLFPASSQVFDTPGYVFGRFLHEVKVLDGAGNVSSATGDARTVNAAPPSPECVRRSGYDVGTDVATFAFEASRFMPVRGS